MSFRFARIALLVANFITGVAILGLASMLPDLAVGLDVSIASAGQLVTAGAVVLCVGSPLMVWATSRLNCRVLLSGALVLVGLGQIASALAPSYTILLALRVVSMAFAAVITPQAASAIALIVPPAERSAAIVFVFLGFSLAIAAGLPLMAFLSAHAGWQATFAIVGVAALVSAALTFAALPANVHGTTLSLQSWGAIARNRAMLLLLLITTAQVSAQFIVFTYLAPLLIRLAGASTTAIAVFFALFGIMGVVGNIIATRLVVTLKPFRTSLLATGAMFIGLFLFSFGAGVLPVMGAGVAVWGLGFAAMNSMQQARLVACLPDLSSASVALNTSAVYVGQAIGSAAGGFLLAHDLPRVLGYLAVVLMSAAFGILAMTHRHVPQTAVSRPT
jgi:MFS transporter, DHA1 family, inner membrane transport protein